MNFKQRFLYSLAILVVGTLPFVGCSGGDGSSNGNKTTNSTSNSSSKDKKKLKLEALEKSLKKKGFEIGEKTEKMHGMIKANDGHGFEVSGETIEVYEYNTGITSGKKAINEMVEKGVMGQKVIRNNNLLLVVKDDHPKWDAIKQTFKNL
jgi:hypothetical protein